MSTRITPPAPEVEGIDLQYRPRSYFWPLGVESHLLSRVKGATRHAELKRLIAAGRLEEAPDFLKCPELSDDVRRIVGRIHPAFMGGEYLPNLAREEVAIARITIASVTQDVTCVYARRGKDRIRYRVVDEYEGQSLSGRNTRTSVRPLTLGELEAFFNGAWSIFGVLEMNFGHGRDAYDVDEMLRFVVGVESEFYPHIGELYERRIRAWAAERRAEQRPGASPAAYDSL